MKNCLFSIVFLFNLKHYNSPIKMEDHKPYLIPMSDNNPYEHKHLLPKSKKILLFDIDNTLYCSSLGFQIKMLDKIKEFVAQMGIKENFDELCKNYYKRYGLTLKGLLINYPNLDINKFIEKAEKELAVSEYIKKDEELIKILESLEEYKLYCFTNAYHTHALKILNAMGITQFFSGIFYCNYTQNGDFICKPNIAAYKFVEEMLDNSEIYFYEDSQVNLNSGIECGWKCEFITKDYNIKTALKKFIVNENKERADNVLLTDLINVSYVEGTKNVETTKNKEDQT